MSLRHDLAISLTLEFWYLAVQIVTSVRLLQLSFKKNIHCHPLWFCTKPITKHPVIFDDVEPLLKSQQLVSLNLVGTWCILLQIVSHGIVKIWHNVESFESSTDSCLWISDRLFGSFRDNLLIPLVMNVGMEWVFIFITCIVNRKMTQNWTLTLKGHQNPRIKEQNPSK